MSLKIKETLKELEKYDSRIKSQETQINKTNYIQDLNELLNKHGLLQAIIREIESIENKEASAISKKSNHDNKTLHHYDSDSNSKFLGTPPRKIKQTKKKSNNPSEEIMKEIYFFQDKNINLCNIIVSFIYY